MRGSPSPRPVKMVAAKAIARGADADRHVDCESYAACLNLAIRRDWPGFTCAACEVYKPIAPTARYFDSPGLLVLAMIATEEDDKFTRRKDGAGFHGAREFAPDADDDETEE